MFQSIFFAIVSENLAMRFRVESFKNMLYQVRRAYMFSCRFKHKLWQNRYLSVMWPTMRVGNAPVRLSQLEH